MRQLTAIVFAGLCLALPASPIASAEPADLSGLWQARLRLGPDLRGPIDVIQWNGGWFAEIGGRRAMGSRRGPWIEFDFGSEGLLRLYGKHAAQPQLAWWVQPPNSYNAYGHATPVRLAGAGAGHWRGEVEPLDDGVTFYLPLHPTGAPGEYGAFLRSPERNAGYFLDVRRLRLKDGAVELVGRPRRSPEDQVVARGRHDAADGVIKLDFPGYAGSFGFRRIAPGQPNDFLPRAGESRYRYRSPTPRADGWPVAHAASVGMDTAALERFIQLLIDTPMSSVSASDIHAVLIARHGKLVLEEYFHGFSRDRLHDLRSAGKSYSSTIAGAVVQARLGGFGTSTPVYATMLPATELKDLDPRKRAMTVEHLLTMTSGYNCDDTDPKAPGSEDALQNQTAERDWYAFTLRLPMAAEPGSRPVYCGVDPNLVGGVVSRATGEPLLELFHRLVAEPLEMKRYAVNLQPTGEPYMGGGLFVEPRDFLKLGQLMLDEGVWRGRRILGGDWAERATSPMHPLRAYRYGYFWWIGEFPHRGRTVKAYFAGGNGGQIAMVVPDLDLAIVFLGGNYGDRVLYVPQREYVPNHILPAVGPDR